jgi:hypothetical protein
MKSNLINMKQMMCRLTLLLLFTFAINIKCPAQKVGASDTIIYEKVDVIPEFIGGNDSMSVFIGSNMNYPKCPDKTKKSRVLVNVFFVVSTDGSIGRVAVTDKGIEKCFADEAMRVVKLMSGKWIPGSINGTPVNAKCLLPLTFMR